MFDIEATMWPMLRAARRCSSLHVVRVPDAECCTLRNHRDTVNRGVARCCVSRWTPKPLRSVATSAPAVRDCPPGGAGSFAHPRRGSIRSCPRSNIGFTFNVTQFGCRATFQSRVPSRESSACASHWRMDHHISASPDEARDFEEPNFRHQVNRIPQNILRNQIAVPDLVPLQASNHRPFSAQTSPRALRRASHRSDPEPIQ